MRRVLLGVVLLGVVGLLVAAVAGAGGQSKFRTSAVSVDALADTGDANGDGVFDKLAARLATLEADDQVSVIVRLRGDLSVAHADWLERAVGGFATDAWLPIVDGFAATMTKAQIEAMARLSSVASIESNGVAHAYNDSAQAAFGVTKARIDAPGLDGDKDGNLANYVSADIVVGVIDSGIDATHPQLDDDKVLEFVDCQEPVSGTCTPDTAFDDNGHGTHVAGTIAGDGEGNPLYKGVAPGAALVGIKVLDALGRGDFSEIIAGIQWAVKNKDTFGIEAINLSLGADGCHDGFDAPSAAVNAAVVAGLVVLVAAGNDGPARCTVGTPGVATNVITVGAMADTGVPLDFANRAWRPGFNLAAFSSRGPTADVARIKPDLVAPGVHVTSADANTTGYVTFNGTSMATPFVAGVAALMLDQTPSLTPLDIKGMMTSTAIDWGHGAVSHFPGTSGADADYGFGRLDAFAAIKAAGAPLGSGPSVPTHAVIDGSLAEGELRDHLINVTDITHPLAATLIMTGWNFGAPDFDLRLFSPTGAQLGSSLDAFTRQEEVGANLAAPGVYRLEVDSFSGSGPYILDVSGGVVVAPPPLPQPPPPTPPPAPPPPPPPPPIIRPPAIVVRCVVPNVKGKTVAKAKTALRARRCVAGKLTRKFSGKVKKGRVIAQSRRPGTRHPRNAKVNLTVSKGARKK